MTARFTTVPIIDVTRSNVSEIGPTLRVALASCDFVAIDCELSGLGDRKKLNASSIEERYLNTSNVAKTRSIISLGLSMFKRLSSGCENKDNNSFKFHVQTFNIMTLCNEDYIVEPSSLQFLVDHGFDFNKQYAQGLPYHRGKDRVESPPSFLREIFGEIVKQKKPIVLHNGFIDLVFLYQNLYAQLPQTVTSFAADLTDMFPAGVYDTKYLCDFVVRKPASFLEYVFRSQQRKNIVLSDNGKAPHVTLTFPDYSSFKVDYVEQRNCRFSRLFSSESKDIDNVCLSYSNHGHCISGKSCPQSHNIDLVVLSKDLPVKNPRKRKAQQDPDLSDSDKKTNGVTESKEHKSSDLNCGGHRAGFDAFMTGFSLATFLSQKAKLGETGDNKSAILGDQVQVHPDFSDAAIVNRVYLVSKDIPFMIRKSEFAKNSTGHSEKYSQITALNC